MNHFNFTFLFLLLSVLFVSNSYFIPFSNPLQKGDWDGANWMKNALPIIGNLTLQQITIPGSHDTGTYNLTDYLIELPDYIVELVELADELDIPVIEIFKAWAKTQDKNYTEQFEAGIRYMDIRVCYDLGQWRNHHGCVLGLPLQELLDQTRDFLATHDGEIIILELDSPEYGNDNLTNQFIGQVETALGKYMLPRAKGMITINEMVQSGKRLIMTFGDSSIVSKYTNLWYSNTLINSYANSPDLSTMIEYNNGKVNEFKTHGPYPGQLFKISWTLTPDVQTILQMIIPEEPHTLFELIAFANEVLYQWFSTQVIPKNYNYPILGNIFLIDRFETSPIFQVFNYGLNGTKWLN